MTNAIFSPESEFGGMAFDALGGLTIVEFGAALAPANLSARQAAALGLTTSGTCGPRGTTSLRSAALQESLASKLRAKTGSNGSTLYRLTWKTRVTPSGRPICALRGSPNKAAAAADFICGNGNISSQPLKGWTTPQAHDVSGRSKTQKAIHGTKHGCADLVNEALATGWPTPTSKESAGGEYQDADKALVRVLGPHSSDLRDFARIATIPADCTAFLIMTPDGQTQISYIAATGGGVQLNPAHSRWLMRFPVAWEQCAPNYEPYALLQALAAAT